MRKVDIDGILKDKWGYSSFRPLQKEIISSVLDGADTLALLPTGGGKSICFQVPALSNDGICLVVSPLIALMKDQVQQLKQRGIEALSLYSGLSFVEVKKVMQNAIFGNYKFLYVSPERLESTLFLEYLSQLPINLIAIDEAHCISQWGYDFRPPYLRIVAIREIFPSIPVIALTASATKEVCEDIIDKLGFRAGFNFFQQSFSRPKLSYSVFEVSVKENKIIEIFKKIPGSGIVYCKTRNRTKYLADILNSNGISSSSYHAGLTNELRSEIQTSWIKNQFRVICCTNAFGMGIDKGDVGAVVHFDIPESLENYYQEAGRAGRNGNKAYAVLLFRKKEIEEMIKQVEIRFPDKKTVISVYKSLVNYLQLPSESGENIYFDFELKDFCGKFKLDFQTAIYALKVLQEEDIIAYSEDIFVPSKLVFNISKEGVSEFEKLFPKYEPIIKGLLRSYHGIFNSPASINEKTLARFINIEEALLRNVLIELHQLQIVEYDPQKNKPQIQFLKDRVRTSDLVLDELAIQKRKKAYYERVSAITTYSKELKTCRSKYIGAYFNDNALQDCNICDNCINNNKALSNVQDIDKLFDFILTDTTLKLSVDDLASNFPYKKEVIYKMVDFLIAEQKIVIDRKGMIILKKKGPR